MAWGGETAFAAKPDVASCDSIATTICSSSATVSSALLAAACAAEPAGGRSPLAYRRGGAARRSAAAHSTHCTLSGIAASRFGAIAPPQVSQLP